MKINRKISQKWFRPVRKSYLPCSWQGLGIYFLYLAYMIILPVMWYRRDRLIWTLFTQVIPLMLGATFLAQYVASKNSS